MATDAYDIFMVKRACIARISFLTKLLEQEGIKLSKAEEDDKAAVAEYIAKRSRKHKYFLFGPAYAPSQTDAFSHLFGSYPRYTGIRRHIAGLQSQVDSTNLIIRQIAAKYPSDQPFQADKTINLTDSQFDALQRYMV